MNIQNPDFVPRDINGTASKQEENSSSSLRSSSVKKRNWVLIGFLCLLLLAVPSLIAYYVFLTKGPVDNDFEKSSVYDTEKLLEDTQRENNGLEDSSIVPRAEEIEIEIEKEQQEEDVFIDNFRYDVENSAYYGNLIVNGYVVIEEYDDFEYVFFKVMDTDNLFLEDYIKRNEGNFFLWEGNISLGCVEEGILSRLNTSDQFGMVLYENSLEDSRKILNSSQRDPVDLGLERYLFTSGAGAPPCYSHFAEVKLLK